jgi:hypothetical protein
MATSTYNLIGTPQVVGSGGASSVTFSSIPNTYTDLKVLMSVRTSWGNTPDWGSVRFNGDTGNNYSYFYLQGSGSATSSGYTLSVNNAEITVGWDGANSTGSTFSNTEMYIPNYASSNIKSFYVDSVEENNATAAYSTLNAMLWNSSAAINSITFASANGATIQQYSTFYLYGIVKQ